MVYTPEVCILSLILLAYYTISCEVRWLHLSVLVITKKEYEADEELVLSLVCHFFNKLAASCESDKRHRR